MRGGLDERISPLCREEEIEIHILLKCVEMGKLREPFFRNKWLTISEESAFKKIISCTKDMDVRNVGNFLCKISCKWQSKIRNFKLELVGKVQ